MKKTGTLLLAAILLFIGSNRLNSQDVSIQVNYMDGLNYLIEGCSGTDHRVFFTLTEASSDTLRYQVDLSGSAALNIDYALSVPDILEFPPTTTELSFPIIAIEDQDVEGEEEVIIQVSDMTTVLDQQSIAIRDDLEVSFGRDTMYVCNSGAVTINTDGPENMSWEPASRLTVSGVGNSAILDIPENLVVTVIGNVGTCSDTTSLQIIADEASIELELAAGNDTLCLGEQFELNIQTSLPADSIVWSPMTGVNATLPGKVNIFPETDAIYIATAFYPNCQVSDSFQVWVDDYYFPDVAGPDTTVCQGTPMRLTSQVPESSTTYVWEPADDLSNDSSAYPLYIPEEDIEYTFIAVSRRGFCSDTAEINISVLEAELDINSPDTAYLCKGDSIRLNATSSEDLNNMMWTSSHSVLTQTTGGTTQTTPEVSTTIIAYQLFDNGCERWDTVFVRVDSLPEFDIEVIPDPECEIGKYCPGETVTLVTQSPDLGKYPDIEYEWFPKDGGIQGSDTTLNVAFQTQAGDRWYTRVTTNNACEVIDSAWIQVVDPTIPINLTDTAVCYNMPVQIFIDDTDLSDYEWGPEDVAQYMSCTECPNPEIVIPPSETRSSLTFTLSGTKEMCCPASVSVTINLIVPIIPIDQVGACPGEPAQIMVDDVNFSNFNWTSNQDMLSCDDCPNPVATVSQATNFTLVAFDNAGCFSVGLANVFVYSPINIAEITASPADSIPVGNSVDLTVDIEPTIPEDRIQWYENGELTTLTGSSVAFIVNNELDNNEYTAEYTDNNGCKFQVSKTIFGIPFAVFIPNAFAPQGNTEENKVFRPLLFQGGAPVPSELIQDFKIFSRWGQKVYDNDTNATGWTGNQDGKSAPPEVYVYILEVMAPNGEVQTYTGDVTLLK
jgi:hypothetical protein